MNAEQRKTKAGNIYYSFWYWDGKKKVRLKQSEHPQFETIKDAKEWAQIKAADFDTQKARALRRVEWKKKYYNFSKLTEEYIEYYKKKFPNSWKNTQFYLYHYVVPYFLENKGCNNPNQWPTYFEDYKDWLENEAKTIKEPRTIIAYASKNHCVKTLNTFLTYLVRNNKVDPTNIYKLNGFPVDKLNSRDADSLISNEDFEAVYTQLLELNKNVAIFFQTAYHTGMRFNEIFGLSIDDLFAGEIEDKVISKALKDHNIDCYGYIVLGSQPRTKTRTRNKDGSIDRKPLKGRKKICEKNNRIVPITDKELYNNLVYLYKEQQKLLKQRKYGGDPKNYVLFEELSTSECNRFLNKGFFKSRKKYRSFHCCRHTRCTELVGMTRDFVLARMWLGHQRQETTLRYTHIYQQSVREVKKKNQKIDFI